MQQQTIREKISFQGVGVHTGVHVCITLCPMPIDTGIQFQRVDLPEQPIVPALVNYVGATERTTTLQKEGAQVGMVEHILAALVGLQVDNICIQLDGPELPQLDGSAQGFVQFLLKAQIIAQNAPRLIFKLEEPFIYQDPDTESHFSYYPAPAYSVHCTLDYAKWPLRNQYATLPCLADFEKEIAGARTFIYLDEIMPLYQKGLLKGGDAQSALILSDQANYTSLVQEISRQAGQPIDHVVHPASNLSSCLRYANEPARHKLLDLMGDLALLGRSLQGMVMAHQPGHGPNTRFVGALSKLLKRQQAQQRPNYDLKASPKLDVNQVTNMLPHRYPFQLVDKIMEIDHHSITGVKNVTINEPFFQGHFPGMPVMPGVLQVEALAQVSGILALHAVPDPEKYLTYFLAIDGCKFRRMVVPGDTLILHCRLLSEIKRTTRMDQSIALAKVEGRIFVHERLVCQATLLAQMVKNHEK